MKLILLKTKITRRLILAQRGLWNAKTERGSLLSDRRKVDGELEGDRLIVWTFVKTTFYKDIIAMQFEKTDVTREPTDLKIWLVFKAFIPKINLARTKETIMSTRYMKLQAYCSWRTVKTERPYRFLERFLIKIYVFWLIWINIS